MPSAPPTDVYVFSSINVINVPAVLDKDGHLKCATTSTYRAKCQGPVQTNSNSTNAKMDNTTQSTAQSTSFHITGVNSNAESYFSNSQTLDPAVIASEYDMVQVSFSEPFVYAPLSDQFPSKVVNENLGYVPEALIEWIVQRPNYVSRFPGIASCLPGGPSIYFYSDDVCSPSTPVLTNKYLGNKYMMIQVAEKHLTVTIPGEGCFHPGACSTPPAPGATAVAATPVVTPGAHSQDRTFVMTCLCRVIRS